MSERHSHPHLHAPPGNPPAGGGASLAVAALVAPAGLRIAALVPVIALLWLGVVWALVS